MRTPTPTHRPLTLLALTLAAALLPACSDNTARPHNIGVTYRFENVRRQGGFDEWTHISGILAQHSRQPVKPDFKRVRRVGDADLRDISAEVFVDDFATLDKIQSDLDKLGDAHEMAEPSWLASIGLADDPKPATGDMLDFSLAEMSLRYTSNFVTSETSVVISGHTTRGNLVQLFIRDGEPPVTATANSNGTWSARIKVLPETQHIYGQSQDPSGRTRPKYFRIQLATLRHENISQSEFSSNAPTYTPPSPASSSTSSSSSKPAPTNKK